MAPSRLVVSNLNLQARPGDFCLEVGQKAPLPHVAAARLYLGACRSCAVPSARYQPLPPTALPLLGGGREFVGSAKLGTPCERMHLASASNCSLLLSDDVPRPPGLCASLAQARRADLKAGAFVLMSLGMISPPVELGSGKFGTPCARMHCASLSSGPPLASACGVFDDPHATTTAAQISAANGATVPRGCDTKRALRSFRTRLVVPLGV